MKKFEFIKGGVTAAQGFRAAGIAAAIKYPDRRDVALLVADQPVPTAAVFTSNQVAAAPVQLGRELIKKQLLQGVLINSGCANACTGDAGLQDARECVRLTTAELGIAPDLILPCSTGVIGMRLPMPQMAAGITRVVAALHEDGGHDAALAIMTTDTVDKQAAVELEIDGKTVVIGGMCKGSGMIEPHMATMLAFVTTDARVEPCALQQALQEAVNFSFNRIVVDGDCSTNDTVVVMASGVADNVELTPYHSQWQYFVDALKTLCLELSRKIVMDGEGATKFVTLRVTGALTAEDADLVARAIAKSPLVKTSWFGNDPNWGRVIAAVGYSGATVDERRVRISYDNICAYDRGKIADGETLDAMQQAMRKRAFEVVVELGMGERSTTLLTCDLSFEYVKINAEYTT